MAQTNLEKYKTLAERYTKALLKIAQENNTIEQTGKELKEITELFAKNPDIEGFFTSPIVKKEDKKEILEKSFKGKIDEKFYNFLNVLTDKNRIFILPNIENIYHEKLTKAENILEVEAQSVIKLDKNMQNALIDKLTKITGKKISLTNTINKDIIGGLVLKFDGKVIDGSVKTQLKRLQKQLI